MRCPLSREGTIFAPIVGGLDHQTIPQRLRARGERSRPRHRRFFPKCVKSIGVTSITAAWAVAAAAAFTPSREGMGVVRPRIARPGPSSARTQAPGSLSSWVKHYACNGCTIAFLAFCSAFSSTSLAACAAHYSMSAVADRPW
jgi:hypothetical protein